MNERDPDEWLEHTLARRRVNAPDYLVQRIVAQIPDDESDPLSTVLDWLRASLWRPAAAMLLPIAIGFSAGFVSTPSGVHEPQTLLFAETLDEVIDEVTNDEV